LNDGWTEQRVLDKMLEYRKAKIRGKLTTLDGLVVRRWWGYAAGSNKLDYDKLLDCRLTAVSQVGSNNLYSDERKYEPIITGEKVNQVLTINVPNSPTVREMFNRSQTGRTYIAAIENMDIHKTKIDVPEADIVHDAEAVEANNIAFEAQTALDNGDYETAASKFRRMIELIPDAYDSYNDLIYTLYKIGNYDEGLRYARILIDLGHDNDVTEDKIFGSAYFNAGLCREAKGELETARANYRTASLRMPDNQTVKIALKRIDGKIKDRDNKKKKSTGQGSSNANKKKNTKPTAEAKGKFIGAKNKLAQRIPEKGSTLDLALYFMDKTYTV
jgi:tetratricopeptide (TPR) repeat protein